jgi:ATP/maltotriose-dependent transcriptional regulator MalT
MDVMTMSFLPFDPNETVSAPETFQSNERSESLAEAAMLPVSPEKIRIPKFSGLVDRPRITQMLKNSASQFPATFVCGRSGTGKTASVAAFAAKTKNTAWNTLEPPDVHWTSFSNSTGSATRRSRARARKRPNTGELIAEPTAKDISRFVDGIFASGRKADLLIFDNVHYVFDTEWFREFFELLLPAVPETSHVIFISRSKPAFPLWRMRSKQFLNLIDEKVFAFDESETAQLFAKNGFPAKLVPVAHQNCFGKVAQMLRFAEAAAKP